jgi:hypothetical protein
VNAQRPLRTKPPTKIIYPIGLPVRINNPPINIAAAGPVPALKLGYIGYHLLKKYMFGGIYNSINKN